MKKQQESEETSTRILFLTHICPYPPSNGGAIKTFNILKHLCSKHDVSLVTFVRNEYEVDSLEFLKSYCSKITYCTIERSGRRNVIDAAQSILTGSSFIISRDWRKEMQQTVLDSLRSTQDLIYVDHLQMFQYVPEPAPCPVLLDEHNVEWRIIERFAQTGARSAARRAFAGIEWPKLKSYELESCRRANRVLTVTPQDRSILMEAGVRQEKIIPLPIGVDIDYFRPIPPNSSSKKILSIGTMSWPPNVDAISHFAESIYPLIKREIPEVTFSVVGANPSSEMKALGDSDPSIRVTGFVDDIRTSAESTAAFVVPLRIGSGMRVKILDAMAMGLPVVTTTIGCEGISLNPGEHALVADRPEEFANAVIHLLQNPKIRCDLGNAGRTFVENNYSWPPIFERLDAAIDTMSIPQQAAQL